MNWTLYNAIHLSRMDTSSEPSTLVEALKEVKNFQGSTLFDTGSELFYTAPDRTLDQADNRVIP
jgi:hypothetical protein